MAKQIILTQNNFGIPIELQFVSNTNSPVDLTDKTVEVAISYDGTIIDVLQAIISSYTNGTAYIIVNTKHTSNVGLYTTFWSVRDKYGYITAQEDLYYYVKGEYNGAENNGIEQDKGTIEEKLYKINSSIESIEEEFDKVNSSIEILGKINSDISTKVSELETINEKLTNDIETINIETINSQLETNTSDISILKTEKYIFIGDSYGVGYTPNGNVTSWIDYTKELMHLSSENCYSYAVPGYGFNTTGFQELINRAVSEIQEKQQVKYIVVGGGYNDSWNCSAIANNMKLFFDTCKANFPNAKVIIAPFGWCVEGLTTDVHVTQNFSNLTHMVLEYQRNALINGGCYIDGIYSVLHKNEFFSSDYVHPNNTGQYTIALALTNYLKGQNFSLVEYMNNENIFKDNVYADGIYVSCQCIATVDGKNTILQLTNGKITGSFVDVKLDGTGIYLGKVRSSAVNGNYEKTVFPVRGIIKTHDSHYHDVDFIMYISHNKLYMSITKVNETNEDYLTLSFTEINVVNNSTPIMINSLIN